MDKSFVRITRDGYELINDLRGAQRAILITLSHNKNGMNIFDLIEQTKRSYTEYRNVDNAVFTTAIAVLLKGDFVEME